MNPITLAFSSSGRLGRRAFAIAVAVVYLLGFASQTLLSGPVLARTGIWLFALVQAVLLWVWFVLHAKRLRAAERGSGGAVGIAIVYGLAMLFLLMVVAFFLSPAPATDTTGDALGTWIVLTILIEIFSGAPDLGLFGDILIIMAVIALTPVLLALGFSIWAGTRPPSPPALA